MKISTHLNHASHGKIASGSNWSNRWTYRIFIINTRSLDGAGKVIGSDRLSRKDLIRTSIYDNYSGAMKITTHLNHISHCKSAAGTNWSNRWTYCVCIMNTRSLDGAGNIVGPSRLSREDADVGLETTSLSSFVSALTLFLALCLSRSLSSPPSLSQTTQCLDHRWVGGVCSQDAAWRPRVSNPTSASSRLSRSGPTMLPAQ